MPQRPPSRVRMPVALRCLVMDLTPIGPEVRSPPTPYDSSARRSRVEASVNGYRTVMRPSQTVRPTSDADDNRTASVVRPPHH